jgi:acyl dehydratase
MTTSFITDDMRALIGVPGPKLTAPYPLGADELRRFVQGVMEGDPVHWDPEAAAASRYGEVVATPLFPMHSPTRPAPGGPDPLEHLREDPDWDGIDRSAAFGGLPAIDLPLKRILNGGTEAEFFQLAKLGDVISSQAQYTDITEREGKSGAMVLVKVQTTYTNQDDETLLVSTMTVIMR